MTPSPMSLFHLLQFLALLVRKVWSDLPVRVGNRLMYTPARLSPKLPELRRCSINDWRNFGQLFGRQVKFGTQSFLHSRADPFRMTEFKEMVPGIQAANERAADSPSDKHQDKSGNQFPSQRPIHLNSSWIAESAMANSFVEDSPSWRFWFASRMIAIPDSTITATDNSAARRINDVTPLGVGLAARQSATTRVSNPNGIPAGASSAACAADRSNRSIFSWFIAFLLLKFSRAVVSFSAGHGMRAL
jgi:hypothetical protein